MSLNQFEVLFYGLAFGFVWRELVLIRIVFERPLMQKLFCRKPFTCLKCMTGWFSLALALISGYEWESGLLLIAGVFIGAIAEGIIMRWL